MGEASLDGVVIFLFRRERGRVPVQEEAEKSRKEPRLGKYVFPTTGNTVLDFQCRVELGTLKSRVGTYPGSVRPVRDRTT